MDSNAGEGTTSAILANERTRTPIILLVDDDEVNTYTLSHYLKAAHFEVVNVATAEEALKYLAAATPDAAIIDIRLPGMNGVALCSAIRATPATYQLPILQISAFHTDTEWKVRSLEAGADAYLPKSADIAELLALLRALIRARESASVSDQARLTAFISAQQAALQPSGDLEGVMDLLCARSCDVTGAPSAVVEIREGDEMVYRAAKGDAAKHLGLRLSVFTSLSGTALRTGEVLRCDDSEIDARVDRDACRKINVRSMVCVPLGTADGLVGVLKVLSPNANAFSDRDVHVMRLMAGMMSTALTSTLAASELRRREEELFYQANHDSLTGLPNRQAFLKRLEETLQKCAPSPQLSYTVLFLDLDRFKIINDSLGHSAGDHLLTQVAMRLRRCVRPSDLIARMGGDEFTLLLETDNADSAVAAPRRVADRICRELAMPFKIEGREVFTGASIGMAFGESQYTSAEAILRDADNAMYRAKSGGRGRVEIFNIEMHQRALDLMQTESDLRGALERNELRLHYQPVVELATGSIVGFEALVRWQHPTRGLLAPGEFIGVAEETRLIVPIGEWILRTACEWIKQLHEQLPHTRHVTIAVNVSGVQFAQPDFINVISTVLDTVDIRPTCLKLEITESTMVERAQLSPYIISRLREMQLQLLLDDFGTGYSSLSYLNMFPLNALKIDRSFINQLGKGGDGGELVRCIIAMADALGMDVIAEGVETEKQAEILRIMGARLAQGYLFSKPVNAESAQALLQKPVLLTIE